MREFITYQLIKTRRRLTFDIIQQADFTCYMGEDDGPYFRFIASNGYEVISRSRMDIQTERLWLLGAAANERSGSMVFSSDEKRDAAYLCFVQAIAEWEDFVRSGDWVTSGKS
jgi:hypothetical protein